ncbi:MAG: hypothetical protein R3D00_14505 [Bacteroidia bacterium]
MEKTLISISKNRIYTLLFFWLAVIIMFLVACGPTYLIESHEIHAPHNPEKLYLKLYSWGFSGSLTYISTSSSTTKKPNKKIDIVYSSEQTLFYRFRGDTLEVLSSGKPHVPEKFNSSYIVKISPYDSAGGSFYLNEHYTSLGYQRFGYETFEDQ